MARHFTLPNPVHERPRQTWGSIATELLGTQTRLVKGERWTHRVVEKGNGPPLFMYHGIGGHVEPYARTLPALARHFTVYAIDALYHGYSSKEPWDSSEPGEIWDNAKRSSLQAEAYVDVLHALGYENAHYEGESMGAFMGVEIGMRFPETVDKMVLNGFPAVATSKTDFKKMPNRGDLFDLSRKAVVDPSFENVRNRLLWLVFDEASIDDEIVAVRQRLYQDPEINASMRRIFGVDSGISAFRGNLWSEQELRDHWSIDTLVMYGAHNPGRGPDYGEYCADLINAQFYQFENAGHWPMWETPDEYAEVLYRFLST